ncbi:hypothetical protein AcV7_007006 [Taiwanofungus camphoratus]|nr:hypothetical protein AcV7_007006 [Antrodia cinnamomea]
MLRTPKLESLASHFKRNQFNGRSPACLRCSRSSHDAASYAIAELFSGHIATVIYNLTYIDRLIDRRTLQSLVTSTAIYARSKTLAHYRAPYTDKTQSWY